MRRDKKLEKEIKRLRWKKRREDLWFVYGFWIIMVLLFLGIALRFIMAVKAGVFEGRVGRFVNIEKIQEFGTCYVR